METKEWMVTDLFKKKIFFFKSVANNNVYFERTVKVRLNKTQLGRTSVSAEKNSCLFVNLCVEKALHIKVNCAVWLKSLYFYLLEEYNIFNEKKSF